MQVSESMKPYGTPIRGATPTRGGVTRLDTNIETVIQFKSHGDMRRLNHKINYKAFTDFEDFKQKLQKNYLKNCMEDPDYEIQKIAYKEKHTRLVHMNEENFEELKSLILSTSAKICLQVSI
jgi:hypothetical protein